MHTSLQPVGTEVGFSGVGLDKYRMIERKLTGMFALSMISF